MSDPDLEQIVLDMMPETPAWVYDHVSALDLQRLKELGPSRPLWTHHFTNWQAFIHYVRGVMDGDRQYYPDWFAPDEFVRAANEVTSRSRTDLSPSAQDVTEGDQTDDMDRNITS